jgi:hypothetical protein
MRDSAVGKNKKDKTRGGAVVWFNSPNFANDKFDQGGLASAVGSN